MDKILVEISNGPKECSTPKVNLKVADGNLKVKGGSNLSHHCMKIFEDKSTSENTPSVRCSRAVQTDDEQFESYLRSKQLQNASTDSGNLTGCFDQDAYDLMVNENIPENYWKDVAEQRRLALSDTLEENKRLSFEVLELKEENRRLSDIAAKADYLQNLLQDALSDDEESQDGEEKAGDTKVEEDSAVTGEVKESTINSSVK